MLTPKREKFCQTFVKTGNQYKAYCSAYNTKNMKRDTIDNNAYKLMQRNEIRTRIGELQGKIESKNIASAQEIQEILTQLLRGEIKEEVPLMSDKGLVMAKKQVTPKDRTKAGEMLAKMRGYYNINLNVSDKPVIVDDIQ